ncbi:MAG TPA: response regulator [Burkholderiaceae bacterium]|jgi:response regulator NasT|nr:response regulator [Burkholderiaceae bacterium]
MQGAANDRTIGARPTRILVVDDDRLVLATVVAGLRQAGFEVLEADNGDDAILLARNHRPRLAILDMRMQGKSGMDVARYLASHTSTGFMFLSAFGDPAIVDETARLGALGYLVKPIDIRQVVPAVNAALAKLDAMPAAAARPAPAAGGVVGREEAIAVGILMERLRLDQARALQALREQARSEGVSIELLATRMVEAANRLNSIARGRPPDPTS